MKNTKSTEKPLKMRIFDTLSQCAHAMNIGKDTLSAMKARGCTAFKHGRVYEAELLEWIRQNPIAPGSHLSAEDKFWTLYEELAFTHCQLTVWTWKNPGVFPKAEQVLGGQLLSALEKLREAIKTYADDDDLEGTFLPREQR